MQKSKIILDEDKTRLEREIQVLKIIRHPNLVHLYSVIEKDDKIYLIMEYNNGIELFDYIVKKKNYKKKKPLFFINK
jgi:serine/threonine protein kinase